jgi:hypothetical protein
MLDPLFSFVEPIIEPTEESLFDFIAQVEGFFDFMEEKGQLPPTIPRPLSEDT